MHTPEYNPADDPVMVSRVFHAKLSKIIEYIRNYPRFQGIIYEMYVIEFQKRGLPHAHIVIKTNWEPQTPDEIDSILPAEIPREPGRLQDLVLQFMVHDCSPDRYVTLLPPPLPLSQCFPITLTLIPFATPLGHATPGVAHPPSRVASTFPTPST